MKHWFLLMEIHPWNHMQLRTTHIFGFLLKLRIDLNMIILFTRNFLSDFEWRKSRWVIYDLVCNLNLRFRFASLINYSHSEISFRLRREKWKPSLAWKEFGLVLRTKISCSKNFLMMSSSPAEDENRWIGGKISALDFG